MPRAVYIVEPCPGGHRFQHVAHVVGALGSHDSAPIPTLLTSAGASERDEFRTFLGSAAIRVCEVLPGEAPTTAEVVAAVARSGAARDDVVIVLDADRHLPAWRREVIRVYPESRERPSVRMLLMRVPLRAARTSVRAMLVTGAKGALVANARMARTLDRACCLVGQGDRGGGRLLLRIRDPAICSTSAHDKIRHRTTLGLPEAKLVGILGGLSERKNIPMVARAVFAQRCDVRLVLAGRLSPGVREWCQMLPRAQRQRVFVHDAYLNDQVLDAYVAALDVVVLAHSNEGPSGLLGKALAAGTPALVAGSRILAFDIESMGGGMVTSLNDRAIASCLEQMLGAPSGPPTRYQRRPLPTADEFGAALLRGAVPRQALVGYQ